MNLILFLLIGGIAGWLAGQIRSGHGFGLFGNIGVGIVGSVMGGFLFGILGIHWSGIIGSLITATIGAIALLALLQFVKKV